MEPLPPVNYVFIDFENVHEFDLDVIGAKTVSLTLLVGAKQTKLGTALVERLLEHASSVQLVRLAASGRNALDFALAYYVGRAAAGDPGGCFHIISRDTGFDPLVEHLKSRNIRAYRHGDVSPLFNPGAAPPKPVAPAKLTASVKPRAVPKPKAPAKSKSAPKAKLPVSGKELGIPAALEFLNRSPARRPKTYTKLVSHLVAYFGKSGNELKVRALIEELRTSGHLSVDEKGAITYGPALK